MKLYLKNIGKIAETSVEINGITVIAGENDTGKSTVGKALFSIFNSFYEVQEQIRQEKMSSVRHALKPIYRNFTVNMFLQRRRISECAADIVKKADQYIGNSDILLNEIYGFFDSESERMKTGIEKEDIENVVNQIIEILNISDTDIFQSIINNKMDSEFNAQILNVYSQKEGEIILEICDKKFAVKILEDSVICDNMNCSLHTEAIYIDNPLVLDTIEHKMFMNEFRYLNHHVQLENKLLTDNNASVVEKIIVEKKLKKIYEKLSSVCQGDIVTLKSNSEMGYQLKNSDKILSIKNLSTGLKTFAILKKLLTNGVIKNNGTIILDEPEIHLHPEWQLLFAEIIVLLHKEFGMHILLNTHSPYFLRAIEVYSAKYGVSDICRYYLSDVKEGGEAYINDVTNEINKIYEKLSSPLQQLEDEKWND